MQACNYWWLSECLCDQQQGLIYTVHKRDISTRHSISTVNPHQQNTMTTISQSDSNDERWNNSASKPIQLGNTSTAESETSVGHLFASKDNTAFKWQRARGVVGALEIKSEPMLKLRDDLTPHYVKGKEKTFHDGLQAWEDLKLREDFIRTSEKLPLEPCCCGILTDQEATKRRFVTLLNTDWTKKANRKLLREGRGVKLDIFLWNWQNASGKAETNILLIRFFELSSYRFRRASADESASIDLELLDEDEEEAADVQSPEQANMAR